MKEKFGTEMYDKKYSEEYETEPRSVVTAFIDQYLTKGQYCLDLGAGAGRHSKYLAEKGINVTAIDMSTKGIQKTKEELREYPNSNTLMADIHHLPFPDESFDSLISNRVLDYNDDKGLEIAFSEIERVIRENSPVLITIRSIAQPSKENERLVVENGAGGKTFQVQNGPEKGALQHYFTEQEIKELAHRHNLEIQEIKEVQRTNKKGKFKAEWQVIMKKIYKQEQEPAIIIQKSTDAPSKVKENPFYDPEFWGRADSPDDIYLPDSDEAISFAMAAHEIGHLVKEGERSDARLDNFEATRVEEQRAWDKGWQYLQKYIDEYYKDKPECVSKIRQAFEQIKTLSMQAIDLSKDMYLERGALDNLTNEEIQRTLKERREKLFSEKGAEFKAIFEEMKKEKIGVRPDWDSFIAVVKKAVQDILRDNEKVD